MTASPLHPCDCDTPHSSGGTVPEIRIRNNEIFGKCLINSLASVYPDLESNMSDYQKVPSVARGGIRADRGTELHPSHRRLAWHNHQAAGGARVARWRPLAPALVRAAGYPSHAPLQPARAGYCECRAC